MSSHSHPNQDRSLPCSDDLEVIRKLLNNGRPLDAFCYCEQFSSLDHWVYAGPKAAYFASRLMSWLGNNRRSHAINTIARRLYPESGEVFLRWLHTVCWRQGEWQGLKMMEDEANLPDLSESQRWSLNCDRAMQYSYWRDFRTALAILDELEEKAADYYRGAISRSYILRRADRLDEALDWAEVALERRPGSVSAPVVRAEILIAKNRDDEALGVLQQADAKVQDYDIAVTIANWYAEREQYPEAFQAMNRIEELAPLASLSFRRWAAGRKAEWHYLSGEIESALAEAEKSPKCFTAEIADRLRQNPSGKRVRLPVPFVRQDRRTCAPATLAAICRYWGEEIDQVEIAEAICYDGTPDHNERHWAAEKGYYVREFRVTPEVALHLIDQEIPFTLGTVEPASAHLQAVVGYDSVADTLIVRDPGSEHFAEYRMKTLEKYAFSGPRGMLLIPEGLIPKLGAIELPDADLYDLLHSAQRALHDNHRGKAIDHLNELEQQSPDHLLVHIGKRALAYYDRNPSAQLEATENMLRLYPDEGALLYTKLLLLGRLAGRKEQIDFARSLIEKDKAPSEIHRTLASLLDEDARDRAEAGVAWERAMRTSPFNSQTVTGMAGYLWWDSQRRAESTELYRLSSCLEILSEHEARTYYRAARWCGQRDQAITFLRNRVEDYGDLSGEPACTLSWALKGLDRHQESLEVLENAMVIRPDDGELLLYASSEFRSSGQDEKANDLLDQAQSLVAETRWLEKAAVAAENRADLEEALEYRQRSVGLEPTSVDAHRELASLLSVFNGKSASIKHLEQVCHSFPGSISLKVLFCEFLGGDIEKKIAVLRDIVDLDPSYGWAYRELALDLASLGRLEEAEEQARIAVEVAPTESTSWGVLGDICEQRGKDDQARDYLRKGVAIDADYPIAISKLIALSPDAAGRTEVLNFCLAEMENQVIDGEGLIRWHHFAWRDWPPKDVLVILREIVKARPDLWRAWTTVSDHLLRMGRVDEALANAEETTERFPLLPRVWVDLSEVYQSVGNDIKEKEALEEALQLNPRWSLAVLNYSYVCLTLKQKEEALSVLVNHTRSRPWDIDVLLKLISLLRDNDDFEQELKYARRATVLSPGNPDTWGARTRAARGDEDELKIIRAETQAQTDAAPLNKSAWESRIEVEKRLGDYEAQLSILNQALKHLPVDWDLVEDKAVLLADLGRYQEAEACCDEEGVPTTQRHWRRGRRAWIKYVSGHSSEGIEMMECIVEEHPKYDWAVFRLIEWHDEKAHYDDVVKWTTHMIRLSPDDSTSYGFRAGAHLALQEFSQAEEDLIKATTISPGYGWATFRLLELQLRRDGLEAAIDTVDRARGQIPVQDLASIVSSEGFHSEAEKIIRDALKVGGDDPRLHLVLSDVLWEKEEKEAAVDAVYLSAISLPKETKPWQALKIRAGLVGNLDKVSKDVEAWCLADVEDRWRWMSYIDLLDDVDAKLNVLDMALSHHPLDDHFVDNNAFYLFEGRYYHQAREYCKSYDKDEIDDKLRAMVARRAAWIEKQLGNRSEAIKQMERALKRVPDSAWGLREMCEWLEEAEEHEAAIPWAEKLVEVAPKDHTSFGFLASALLNVDRKQDAVPHLDRALRMCADYPWASDNLFAIQLEEQDWNGAEETIRIITNQVSEADVLSKEVALLAARDEKEEAFLAWDRLVRLASEIRPFYLARADRTLQDKGWGDRLKEHWEKLTKLDVWNTAVVGRWVYLRTAAKDRKVWTRFADLHFSDEQRIEAWTEYIDAAATYSREGDTRWRQELQKAIRKEAKYLKNHTATWGKVCWFYAGHTNLGGEAARWVRDWKDRTDLESWMLVNVAEVMEFTVGVKESQEVRRWAVKHLPHEHGASYHRLELAYHAALSGRFDEAKVYLRDINTAEFETAGNPKYRRFKVGFSELLVAIGDSSISRQQRYINADNVWRDLVVGYKSHVNDLKSMRWKLIRHSYRYLGVSHRLVKWWLTYLVS